MKFYFLDTSALVKRYHAEKGTAGLKEAKPIFVCADKKLISVAEKEGLKAINPENQ